MATKMAATEVKTKHLRQLVLIFFLWKTLLLGLAAFCPGPGYDTSALMLIDPSIDRHTNFSSLSRADRLTLNLFRWDALYTVKAAERGKIHEQEWAFSWAYSRLLGSVGQLTDIREFGLRQYIVAGILISNFCHLLSVVVLYQLLTITVGSRLRHQIAFIGAALHVMTSASLFLSAPYTEAPFSLLNLTGMFLYARSRAIAQTRPSSVREDAYKLGSGIMFAFGTLMRSNGLLSGLILLYDAARYLPQVALMQLTVHDARKIAVTCTSGAIVALGYVWPQYLAYNEFCTGDRALDGPPWCMYTVPSVYTWVQSHYWDVGLFRYWTLPNIPLFLMAAPMLWLLLASSVTVLRSDSQPPPQWHPVPQGGVTTKSQNDTPIMHYVPELALPQLVLAIAALASFHVQIVNRLASGYPTWYLTVATWLIGQQEASGSKRSRQRSQWIIRGMLMYALSQGMLFANFLPPA